MKPGLPQGVRDFLPSVVRKRNYLFDTIRQVMEQYAFVPIETPSVENLATLTGKYGDEGDKLIFKILNNGDYLKKADETALNNKSSHELTPSIAKRGLRYDLTVPFARYVVMNRNDLSFPFKRYQIQPVWRADRPQKNRYREFYQCDADVVGSESLLYEAELIQIYDQVFHKLELPVVIRVNNRKILTGISQAVSGVIAPSEVISAIDKMDKIGLDRVIEFLETKDPEINIELLTSYLQASDYQELKNIANESVQQGVQELQEIFNYLHNYSNNNIVKWDPSLARGLDYYTGCIFEVAAQHDTSVSIGGGGRYANLTEIFGLKNMSGVGISFGADRIYNMLEDLNLWPTANNKEKVFLVSSDSQEGVCRGFQLANKLRLNGLNISVYPEPAKWKKQFKYADQINAYSVIIIGEQELNNNSYSLKNLSTGDQQTLTEPELLDILTS